MANAATVSPTSYKRVQRGVSSDALLGVDDVKQGSAKRREIVQEVAAPLLPPSPGESQAAFFNRLGSLLRRDLFTSAHAFDRDGLYIYKRPVRSEHGDKASLLASGGSVFHHVVVYVKQGEELTALELGPANQMDITDNMLAEATSGPVLLRPAPPPDPEHLPMLHIAAPHHSLDAEHVQQALKFAEGTMYHALKNNCICFADFAVRVLTGGAVRGAPLIFDALVGQVPLMESPLLPLLTLTMQMSWHDVCDGGRLTAAFLRQHPAGLPQGEAGPSGELASILVEPAVPAVVEQGVPQQARQQVPAQVPNLAGLMSLVPPEAMANMAPGLVSMLAGAASAPAPCPSPPQRSNSSGSDDTVGGMEVTTAAPSGSASADASLAGAQLASSGASASCTSPDSSTGTSKKAPAGTRGMALPPRKTAATKGRGTATARS